MKQRLLELLHRELIYSGSINEEMSSLAIPLAIIGIENADSIQEEYKKR